MAALSRLQQRIKENFQETTRDISLLTGSTTSTATYFDTSDDKLKEISKLLESRSERERLEGMKRIIAGISKGRDMEGFFAQVVKNVVAPSIEIRKLVYIYLLRFASTNSDLLLLSINTFQKDLSDPSPLIRSMSLRVLTSIRVPVIQGIVMLGLKKLVNDRNPWVRKTVAGGLAKVYEMDSSSLPQLIAILQTLLASPSPLTLGATLTAFLEICPDRLDLLHPFYRHICRLVVDADEWGQVVALEVLTRYARTMLQKPETPPVKPATKSDDESEDEFEGIDIDLAMFLHCARPLFQSRNPAVVLVIATTYFHLAPLEHPLIGQKLLVPPLLRLAGAPRNGEEITALTWDVIAAMVEERPDLFAAQYKQFFVHSSDSTGTKTTKIRALVPLINKERAQICIREFKHYTRDPEDVVAEAAIKAIGHCVRTQGDIAATGLSALMKLLNSQRDSLVASAVIVLKSVILSLPTHSATDADSLPDPQRLVARLAKGLDGITNSKARASVYWLVGQYASVQDNKGMGWEGVAPWVPDVLRKGVKGFTTEPTLAKLQILTLTTKLLTISPAASQLLLVSQYLFTLARYDMDYDVRDRARFLHALLRGVRDEKKAVTDDIATDQEDEEDLGGVVLRREQVSVVLLGKREAGDEQIVAGGAEYQVGSLSRITQKRLLGYRPLPEWTDDPTDSSLREAEAPSQAEPARISAAPTPRISTPTNQNSIPTPIPMHMSNSAASLSRSLASSADSPIGSVPPAVKGKFQDLDKFLDSESETEDEETDEEESEDERPSFRPATAPPRSAIVPEYDETSSEEDDDDDDDDDEDTDSGPEDADERAALYGQYR